MTLVITMCTGLTSCELFMSDNPSPSPSPTPTPTPTPTPPTYKSDAERPLTFEATVDGVTVTFKFKDNAKPDYKKVEYSLDGGATWTALSGPAQPILLKKAGDIVMFRGDNPTYNGDARFIVEQANSQARSNTRAGEAILEKALATLYGNLAYLLESLGYDLEIELNENNAGAFKELFKNAQIETGKNGHVLVLPRLGAIAVPDVFMSLFEGTTITQAPTVSVGTVAKGTMSRMFYNCPYLKEVTLELGSLAEGVTAEQGMGDILGGNTGTKAEGVEIHLGDYNFGDYNGNEHGFHGSKPVTITSNITLDDVINASGLSKEVLDNATATIVDENGKASEPVKIETVTGLGLNVSHNGQGVSLIELTVGEKYECNINAYVKPETATDKRINVYIENPRIAELKMGYGGTANPYTIIAYSPGETALTAAHGDFAANIPVIVYATVESVKLNKSELDLTIDETFKLTATIAPEEAKQDVTWTTNDTKVATVDKDGVVKAVAPGTAQITAKAGEKTATCAVTVKANGPSIDDPGDYGKGGDPTATE